MNTSWDWRNQVYVQDKQKMGTVVEGKMKVRTKKPSLAYEMRFDRQMNPKACTKSPLPQVSDTRIIRERISIRELVNPNNDATLPSDQTLRSCFACTKFE
jgi:hypothetical protein